MSHAIRAFFAIELDADARRAAAELLEQLRRAPHGDAVRWVRTETLHVTLRFLGDIAPARVEGLARRVGDEVAERAPFEVQLGSVQLFPPTRRPRVVALELGPEEPLQELAAAVERGVVAEGFEPEGRRFRPHLTLGRLRGRPAPETRGLTLRVASPVREAVLFRSDLERSGARHTPLARLPLKGTRADDHP